MAIQGQGYGTLDQQQKTLGDSSYGTVGATQKPPSQTTGSTPTVLSDSGIRDKVIPDIQADASKTLPDTSNPLYARPGETQAAYQARVGPIQNPDGTPGTTSDANSPSSEYDDLYSSVMGTTPQKDNSYDSDLALVQQMQKSSDTKTSNQLAGISAQFQQQRNDLQANNEERVAGTKLLLSRGGGSGMTGSGASLISATNRGYIRDMSTLDLQEQQATNDALAAQADNNYKLLGEKLDVLKDKRTEKLAVVNKLYDNMVAEKKQTQSDINNVLSSAAEAGAPKAVQDQIGAATSMSGAIQAAGTWLQTSNDPTTNQFLNYQRQATLAGQVPLNFDDWNARNQKQLASQKYAEAYATESAKNDADLKYAGQTGGGASVSSPATAAALSTILGSGKFTKDQTAQITKAINNGEDPFTVIKNQAKNIMGQTEATKLTSYEAADNAMKDLQQNIQAFYDGGGDTGLIKGNLETANNRLFGATGDPKKVELATQVAISLQAYRNAISGTAYSEQEGQDISAVFPGINKSQGLNTAVINGRLKADSSIIDGIYKTALGDKTYSALKDADTASNAENDPVVQTQVQDEQTLTSGLAKLKLTNPAIYSGATQMWNSINPETGQPYTTGDIYSAFPELQN